MDGRRFLYLQLHDRNRANFFALIEESVSKYMHIDIRCIYLYSKLKHSHTTNAMKNIQIIKICFAALIKIRFVT